MASKNSNDLTVTIKEGKSLITALIDAINENTEAVKRATGGKAEPEEATAEKATQKEQSDAPAPEQPAAPAPVQQTAPNPLPQPTVMPPQAQAPVAPPQTPQAVPAPQGYPQQAQTGAPVNYAPQQSTPAQTPYMPGVPNTMPQQATPNYPASAAGPAPGTNMTGAAPTTATTPGVSAVNPPSAPTGAGITLDMIANAGAELVEKGYMAQVLDILHRHGVDSANALKPEHYAEVAQELRALGATSI